MQNPRLRCICPGSASAAQHSGTAPASQSDAKLLQAATHVIAETIAGLDRLTKVGCCPGEGMAPRAHIRSPHSLFRAGRGYWGVPPTSRVPVLKFEQKRVAHILGSALSGTIGETMTSIIKKSFSSPDDTKKPFAKGTIESVNLGGLEIARETVEPGWKWSEHVKPVAKTESCQKYHVKYFLSGRQMVLMDDGTQLEFGPGDLAIIQPGHDAWVVGDEPNVLLELSGATRPSELSA